MLQPNIVYWQNRFVEYRRGMLQALYGNIAGCFPGPDPRPPLILLPVPHIPPLCGNLISYMEHQQQKIQHLTG